jgi:hypothetical protein
MLDEVEAEEAMKKKGKKETKCAGNGKEAMMESQGNSSLDAFYYLQVFNQNESPNDRFKCLMRSKQKKQGRRKERKKPNVQEMGKKP